MPRKIRELIRDLENTGFVKKGVRAAWEIIEIMPT